jgi:hypothetical protein
MLMAVKRKGRKRGVVDLSKLDDRTCRIVEAHGRIAICLEGDKVTIYDLEDEEG